MKISPKLCLLFFLGLGNSFLSCSALADKTTNHPCVTGDEKACNKVVVNIIENRMMTALAAKMKPGGINGLLTDKSTCEMVGFHSWYGCQTKEYYDIVWPEPPPPPPPPPVCTCENSPVGCVPKSCGELSILQCATQELDCKAYPVDLAGALKERSENPKLVEEARKQFLSRIESLLGKH